MSVGLRAFAMSVPLRHLRTVTTVAHSQTRGSNLPLRATISGERRRRDARVKAYPAGEGVKTHPSPGKRHGDLPKNFEHLAVEEPLYQWWEEQGYFHPNEAAPGAPFVIPMPPPNVTGALHMGHAMFVTLQDVMTRSARMRGRKTLWLPGTDHAGIATQLVVERKLESEGVKRTDMTREEFVDRVWEWKAEYGGRIQQQIKRLGASCDWSRERFTLDEGLSESVLEAFITLHDRGLIYKGTYMVNWAPKLQTAVSDLEVEYSEEPGTLFYFKYPVEGGSADDYLPVATTRPETILGDTAVAVHPDDARYKHLIGKKCVVPLSGGRTVPIIGDTYVDMEFGTGALKITPGHDPNDYEIGKRVGLDMINILNKDGSMNANCGKYNGLDRSVVRTQLWKDMGDEGLVLKEEPYTLRVPRSQRGGEVIEPIVSEQWFCKMDSMAEPSLKAVETGELTIVPQRFEKIYKSWLTDIRDWCISRQLWWGHRIPVWYVHDSAEDLARACEGEGKGSNKRYVVARNDAEAEQKAKAAYGDNIVLHREEDVLDTWFSSGLWPFSTQGWPNEDAPDMKNYFPASVLETGHDILFFWVARMIMMSYGMTGKLPFHTVFLHGLVRDAQGRKMSKSLGNVVDPLGVIAEQGTDALRFTLATGTAAGQDLNLNLERLASNRNFTNKIWNAGKFVLYSMDEMSDEDRMALVDEGRALCADAAAIAKLPLAERWIVSKLNATVDHVTTAQDKYDFGEAGRATYTFFYDSFADWYIEGAKSRLYGDDAAASRMTKAVSLYVLDQTLRLLHPFVPYVTEEVWQALPHRGEALIGQDWPALNAHVDTNAVNAFENLQKVVTRIRNARAEYSVEPAKRIPAYVVCADAALNAELAAEINVIATLARLNIDECSVSTTPPAAFADAPENFVQIIINEQLEAYLPLAGLADPVKEIARLTKQQTKMEKEIAGLAGRVNSPSFTDKAPPAVVDKARKELSDLEEQLAAVVARVRQMESLV
jgi:valyl-tRNA synthetase